MPSTIIVGIDFGTTFSGAAWAISKRPEDIQVITNWESETNGCSDRGKCPTHLQYGEIDHETPWGYNVPTDKDLVRWFKLLLLDEADLPSAVVENPQFKEVREQQGRLKTSPIELVACFLRSLWKHCMENITRALGSGEVASCRFHIVMTVPAIWPHYVQARMKSAADLAGMLQKRGANFSRGAPTLEFLSEPEAAALSALAEMHPRPDIKEDDIIIVCDAGGGTANFDDLITDKMGGSPWKGLDSADKRKFMKEIWENGIKSQFSGNNRKFCAEIPEGYLPDGAMGKRKRSQIITLDRYLFNELVEAYPDSTILNPASEKSSTLTISLAQMDSGLSWSGQTRLDSQHS
ncbi:Heat shock protein 12A [Beauveria bassiana]|uniref:Heat shock protein 12A n=1 Tax=Beauveria bassiana TaxID=176275 RepID=A0A2N6NQ80_BEABA|nr:Heat shock protein 12A [Beauveria bassiana]